jgi:hypothetical protein
MLSCSLKNIVSYVCGGSCTFLGSPKVWEHPQALGLKWPSLMRTHEYKNLPYNLTLTYHPFDNQV